MQNEFVHLYPSLPLAPQILSAEGAENPGLRILLEAWRQICLDAPLPLRPEPMLKSIKHLLKFVHLSDVLDGGQKFRFRVLGDAVFLGLKESQAGRLVSDHPDPGISLRFTTLMRSVVEQRTPIRGLSTRVTGSASYDLEIESIWLPFGSEGIVTQILSMAAFRPLAPAISPGLG